MAAPVKNERILATKVRDLSLKLITRYLEDESPENDKFRKELVIKLAGTVLPRITQFEGEDGAPIQVQITGFNYISPNDKGNSTNNTTQS